LILAAGLTPAWQQILLFDGLKLGQVNRAREAHWTASGKVLNVGPGSASPGRTQPYARARRRASGEEHRRAVRVVGINCRWVRSEKPTRVCTTLSTARAAP